ncbi:MAG TPA: ATP-binding cassette domain-containing protein [Ilumatobacteraceae bacterium]|nr:ATP-binding cassette domain-containing protein [Ilumatobacteraceae bacterium]
MLAVDSISKRFGDVVALDQVSLQVSSGQIVGFLGPNGAGKSTTMRAIMGLIAVDGGSVTWNDLSLDAERRRRFGYMPAERGMYPKMTVADQIVYFARLTGMGASDAKAAAERWMQRVDIASRRDDEVQALSSGNQQRVQLAIALVHEPDLLILDEPFSGLDPVAVENMKQIILDQVGRGTAVLFSSHQLDLVSDISRDVVIIDGGRVVLHGDVRDLRDHSESRTATVTFAAPVSWTPRVAGAVVTRAGEETVVVRVPRTVGPADILADAATAGEVAEFSFAPPDLSEVFLAAVGRTTMGQDEAIGERVS